MIGFKWMAGFVGLVGLGCFLQMVEPSRGMAEGMSGSRRGDSLGGRRSVKA